MTGPRRRLKSITGPLQNMASAAVNRRLALHLTQQEVADLAAVGLSSVRALEAGFDTLTLAVLLRILHALGLDLVAVEGGVGTAEKLTRIQPTGRS